MVQEVLDLGVLELAAFFIKVGFAGLLASMVIVVPAAIIATCIK